MITRRSALAFMGALPFSAHSLANRLPLKIGVVCPITGPYASYGERIKTGADLWGQAITAAGGLLGRPVEFIYEDDAADPKQARSVAEKISAQGVFAVLGHGILATTMVALPVYEENKILLLGNTNADDLTKSGSPYVVRTLPRNQDYAPPVVDVIAARAAAYEGAILCIDDNTDYGKGLADAVTSLLKDHPIDGARIERMHITNNQNDYTAEVTRMRKINPSIVLLSMPETTAAAIVREASRQQFTPFYVGHSRLALRPFPQSITEAGANATVVSIPGADPEHLQPAQAAVFAAFRAAGKECGDVELATYAGLDLLAQGVAETGTSDTRTLSAALHARTHATVAGLINFDTNGNLIHPPLSVYQVRKRDGTTGLALD